ncbi:MAG: undecaprenyl-diphosphate phosphatase [Holosporales bacterium]|jgi:undecaprenyl-diphosphatase|nr:undecaprenyl-diphosphate phosphatase [Holosporales bacterium]
MSVSSIISFVIQGITEFLPVSSTAHLYFFSKLFGDGQVTQTDTMALNLIPGIVLLLYFYKDVWQLFLGFTETCRRFCSRSNVRAPLSPNEKYFRFFFWATLPISVIGLLLSVYGISAPQSVKLIAINSIVFGILLGWADIKGSQCASALIPRAGKIFGLIHVISYIPGVSRLGVCITAARLMGFSREVAVRVSFVCGIPALLGTGALGVWKTFFSGSAPHAIDFCAFYSLCLYFCGTFLLGFTSLFIFMLFTKKHNLLVFAAYRVVLGIGLL